MPDVLCERCKGSMKKKGTLMMSNSKFEVLACSRCGAEKKICLGVMSR